MGRYGVLTFLRLPALLPAAPTVPTPIRSSDYPADVNPSSAPRLSLPTSSSPPTVQLALLFSLSPTV